MIDNEAAIAKAAAEQERLQANVPEEPIEDDPCEECSGWGEILQDDGSYEFCLACDATGRNQSG
jgi:hypothetical protein